MKKQKQPARPARKSMRNGAKPDSSGPRERRSSPSTAVLRHPKTDLEQAIQRYVDLYDFGPIPYVSFDRGGRIKESNFMASELLGRARRVLLGTPLALYVVREDSQLLLRHLFCCRSGERRVDTELRLKNSAGEEVPVELSSTPSRSLAKDGALLYQTAIIDLRKRKHAEAALHEAQALLETRVKERTAELHMANKELKNEIRRRKGLEGQILEISDREQQRLGEELHDGLCQDLTAIGFMARAAAVRLKDHRVFQVDDIEKITGLINAAANDARNIARGLHRIDVDSAGFLDALRDLVDREIWKTPCRLKIKEPFDIEDDAAAAHLYRIAREAMINANKHAQAREIVVHLARLRTGIVLSVTDNGVGLPKEPNKARGLGFRIMNYRAQAAGGRLEVTRGPNGGTRVACHLPDLK